MKLFRIFILALLTTALIACGGAEERKAVYLEKAKSSIEAGDLDKARIELKNVLQIDPKDAEAYFQLGKVYEQLQNYRKAFANYKKAEEFNPDHLANQAKLGRIYLVFSNSFGADKVQEKIDFILSKDPGNVEGLLLKAAQSLKNKNKSEAIKIAEKVVAATPGHVDGATFLAAIYASENKLSDAVTVLEKAIKLNPGNELLSKRLAFVLVKNKDYARAETIYKNFLEKNPNVAASYNNLANFYSISGDKAKAEKILRVSIDNDPGDIERQVNLVKYIKTVKGNTEAATELKRLIDKNKSLGKLRIALAELLYLNGDKSSAIDVYKQAINDFPEEDTGVNSRISLAAIYLNDQDYEKATAIIDEVLKISPNDPKANLLKARLALREKNIEQAIISLRIVTKETPENVKASLLLAEVYKMDGNEEQLNSTLNSVYEQNRTNAEGLLTLAEFYLNNDINKAEKVINRYNEIEEVDYEGLSIKASILNQKKAFTDAFSVAETLMQSYPDKPNGYLLAVPYFALNDAKQKAISVLETGYLNAKDNRKILVLLSSLQVAEKQFEVVINRIKAELKSSPKNAELNLLLAKVYIAKNDTDSAERSLMLAINSDSQLEMPYLLLSQLYQSKRDFKSAKAILIKGMGNVKASIKLPLRLASVYEYEGAFNKAIDLYRTINNQYPNNPVIMNNLASLLSDYSVNKDDLALAKSLADKLKGNDQPVYLDTIGWVHYKLGEYQKAIQYLSKNVEMLPKVTVFNYHLGMAYKMSGDKAKAKVYLEKSLANGKEFKEKDLAKAALKEL